jgi:hypothetical protein
MSKRGIIYTAVTLGCWYLSNFTNNMILLFVMIGLILFLDGFLWPEHAPRIHRRGQGRTQQIVGESPLIWISKAPVYQAIGQSIASKSGRDATSQSSTSERSSGG